MLFTSHNTPHITLGNEQCLKLLLGVCNIKKWGDFSLSLILTNASPYPNDLRCNSYDVLTLQEEPGIFFMQGYLSE
jgi:hypothetical protein